MRRLFTLLLSSLFIGATAQDVNITGFDGEVHTGGSTLSKTVEFPSDVTGFTQVLMDVSLGCPPGGCDPWDRFAQLMVMDDEGNEIEIGRYVTPYGNNWCGWTIDVTEYRTLLQGPTEIVSHIETWSNGWTIHTDFEFIEGTPDYDYVEVEQFYKNNQFTYGDTIFYSINLPDFDFDIPSNAEEVIFRVMNTGHGQGNTDNAAEFSPRTHMIYVNGNMEYTQFLWKDDCEFNPCSPQGGTWQFDRAGWCPGEDVTPWDYDVTEFISVDGTINLDYVLEPFFNECSPWNPGCGSQTCAECTYNSDTHTEPVYKVGLQLIVKSSTPLPVSEFDMEQDLGIEVFPNPTTGIVFLSMKKEKDIEVNVLDITGQVVLNQKLTSLNTRLDLSDQKQGIYLLQLSGEEGAMTQRLILNK